MMKTTKIIHKSETRIKVDFPYNREFIVSLRQIEGAKWSQTHKSWHIPYTKEAFLKLKSLFPEIIFDTPPKIEKNNGENLQIAPKIEPIILKLPETSSVLVEVIANNHLNTP